MTPTPLPPDLQHIDAAWRAGIASQRAASSKIEPLRRYTRSV